MRICVNTRLLLQDKLEGLGWFSYETLKRITQQHPEHEFIFIFDRKYSEEFIFGENVTPVIAHPQARHPVLWYLFFEWGIPPIVKKYKPDLFLSPDGWLSLRTRVPSLAVIHDLNFFHNPQWISNLPLKYYEYFFPKYVKKATRIATVSEFSKNDISSRFSYDKDKIDVVYNGANEIYTPLSQKEIASTRRKYSKGLPYFLFVSLVHPRKNLTRIIQAYDQFRTTKNVSLPLIVVGSTKYWTDDTRLAFEGSAFREDILFLGRLSTAELRMVLGSALALVYTSLFEGFGIPIIEAMQAHVPVITSTVTSMPEIGGDAAIYADPYQVESIAEAMSTVFSDEKLRKTHIEKGIAQANKFSWQGTSEKLWQSICKATGEI
ncbi:MAG: glycosyltransferase family 4 protein [Bacteroidales bacterium]|nr:glycosyltransferase family 4 protein [Bacteroidales bacterium]